MGLVAGADDVGQRLGGLADFGAGSLDLGGEAAERPFGTGVADFDFHLRGQVHLARDLGDAARAEARFGEVPVAFQPDAAADEEVDAVLFDVHVVGGGLVAAGVDGVLLVVSVDGFTELLLGQGVVFVRHPDVPKDVLVAGFGAERVVGKLHVVVIGPYRYQLELMGVAVIIGLEIVGAVFLGAQAGQFRAFLEGDALDPSGYLVTVRVEVEAVVREVEYLERAAVLAGHLLAAHRTDCAGAAGVDAGEGGGLVMVPYAVLLHVHVHMLHAAGQLEPAVAVFFRVDVPAAAYRVQTGVELDAFGHVALHGGEPLAVGQRDFFAPLAAAHVHRLPLAPPFGPVTGFFGHLFQGFVAVFALVVDDDIFRTLHRADLPVGGVIHPVVYTLNDEGHVFPRRRGQREHRFVHTVRVVQHEEALQQALDAVELHVVLPLLRAHLLRLVTFHEPVPLAHELGVVVHLQRHVLI